MEENKTQSWSVTNYCVTNYCDDCVFISLINNAANRVHEEWWIRIFSVFMSGGPSMTLCRPLNLHLWFSSDQLLQESKWPGHVKNTPCKTLQPLAKLLLQIKQITLWKKCHIRMSIHAHVTVPVNRWTFALLLFQFGFS